LLRLAARSRSRIKNQPAGDGVSTRKTPRSVLLPRPQALSVHSRAAVHLQHTEAALAGDAIAGRLAAKRDEPAPHVAAR
jgi:hypothetical protein